MAVIAILLLVLWAYAAIWTAGFVYEDRAYRDAVAAGSSWRPLTLWTWALAPTPISAHALNLGLHLVVAALLGWLVLMLGSSHLAGWAATAIFAVHPLTVEAVAYASGRAELLAAIGVILACLCAVKGRWWLCAGCLAFGLAGKESAVVGLLLVPLVAWRSNRERWPAVMALALILAGIAFVGWSDLINRGEANGFTTTWGAWLLVQSTAVIRLITQAVLPLSLTVDFDYDAVPLLVRIVSLVALLGLAAFALSQRRTLVGIGLLWCLLAVSPRLAAQTPKSYLNEHQFYTPFAGLVIAGAGLVKR